MGVVERLTLEAAHAETLLALEHRHRYQFAAPLCSQQRVLDLCCGSGYGSAILAASADTVVGVDNDASTIADANLHIGSFVDGVSFICADAVTYVERVESRQFDVIVCFEGLEHLSSLSPTLESLRRLAQAGTKLIVSLPNDQLADSRNPFHLTAFGYRSAVEAFADFPAVIMLPQFLAEGSLICPHEALSAEVAVLLTDRDEPEYANHFIFFVNFAVEEIAQVHHGSLQVAAAPAANRWAEGLKRALEAVQVENARLFRAHLPPRRRGAEPTRVTECGHPGQVQQLGRSDDPNNWHERHRRARDYLIPWIAQTFPLDGKTVLEYGCGDAPVSCALGAVAEKVVGADIDPTAVEVGKRQVAQLGLVNVDLELHEADDILGAIAERTQEIDVFLLYAVLEHLTVADRLAVLRLARQVVKPDGCIVVCETPNRLIYFDHHTAQMPFFHFLPDELALAYADRSSRRGFTDSIAGARSIGHERGLEAITRWGRGVSFHEFELVFGDLTWHVIASNYDPLLFDERPVHADEVVLARYLERWRPDLAPVWSRYWLDVILAPDPIVRRPLMIRPWAADTRASDGVSWTRDETLYFDHPGASLMVDLPRPTERLVIGTRTKESSGPLMLESIGMDGPMVVQIPPSETPHYAEIPLSWPAQQITVTSDVRREVIFVGFDT